MATLEAAHLCAVDAQKAVGEAARHIRKSPFDSEPAVVRGVTPGKRRSSREAFLKAGVEAISQARDAAALLHQVGDPEASAAAVSMEAGARSLVPLVGSAQQGKRKLGEWVPNMSTMFDAPVREIAVRVAPRRAAPAETTGAGNSVEAAGQTAKEARKKLESADEALLWAGGKVMLKGAYRKKKRERARQTFVANATGAASKTRQTAQQLRGTNDSSHQDTAARLDAAVLALEDGIKRANGGQRDLAEARSFEGFRKRWGDMASMLDSVEQEARIATLAPEGPRAERVEQLRNLIAEMPIS